MVGRFLELARAALGRLRRLVGAETGQTMVEYAIRRVVEIVDQAWHGRSKNAKVMQHVQVIKEWLG